MEPDKNLDLVRSVIKKHTIHPQLFTLIMHRISLQKQKQQIEESYKKSPDSLINVPIFAILEYEVGSVDKKLKDLEDQIRDRRLIKLNLSPM